MGDASDLITFDPSTGNWKIRATSPNYSVGTLQVKITVSLEHVDPNLVTKNFLFQLTIN